MTSASNQQITRCPKCGTAFRITQAQLQSANGAVRCGSCLNVFKAMDHLVVQTPTKATPANTKPTQAPNQPVSTPASIAAKAATPVAKPAPEPKPAQESKPAQEPKLTPTLGSATKPSVAESKPGSQHAGVKAAATKAPEQLAILSSIKPLPITPTPVAPLPSAPLKVSTPPSPKPIVRTLDKSSLEHTEDILISDDMEDGKPEPKSYEFDGFMDIDTTPKAEVSLFERKQREQGKEELSNTDESWAEMLIEEEETPRFVARASQPEEHPEDYPEDLYATQRIPEAPVNAVSANTAPATPGLVFSLVGDTDDEPGPSRTPATPATNADQDDLILSEELANIPDHVGFIPASPNTTGNAIDPGIFETPEATTSDDSPKRQVKTQPKIRAYDGSRTALLMNIIPAPIEFTAKRMRRWYQRKLWPALSLLALIGLVVQLGWFKFDYFSRVEPYRTAYTFLCPHVGCQVPTLVDTSQISAFNLVVREHPETAGALAVDVMIMNNAPFDQPYPDLVLMFTDLDDKEVASRRFSPKEYLGGEAAGSSHMPQKQPVHLTLDLVDPGETAVNYHIYIPRQ